MRVEGMDIPKSLGEKDFKWFKKFYKNFMEIHVTTPVEDVYVMLGGVLPKKKEPKGKNPE